MLEKKLIFALAPVLLNIYDDQYEKEPIGGDNPYYCCSFCGHADPMINGNLFNHGRYCNYMHHKLKDTLNSNDDELIKSVIDFFDDDENLKETKDFILKRYTQILMKNTGMNKSQVEKALDVVNYNFDLTYSFLQYSKEKSSRKNKIELNYAGFSKNQGEIVSLLSKYEKEIKTMKSSF